MYSHLDVDAGRSGSSRSLWDRLLDWGEHSNDIFKYSLFAAFIGLLSIYLIGQYTTESATQRIEVVASTGSNFVDFISSNRYSDRLLREMGDWMEEMGYGDLAKEELIQLRNNGVTATFTSKMRELGYDPSLEDLVRLRQHDVSATFTAMMHELGYTDLTIDDLVRLRDNGVKAYYTSNLHDLGYSDVTMEELIRLKNARVKISQVKRLVNQSSSKPDVEELIRYGISNQ